MKKLGSNDEQARSYHVNYSNQEGWGWPLVSRGEGSCQNVWEGFQVEKVVALLYMSPFVCTSGPESPPPNLFLPERARRTASRTQCDDWQGWNRALFDLNSDRVPAHSQKNDGVSCDVWRFVYFTRRWHKLPFADSDNTRDVLTKY